MAMTANWSDTDLRHNSNNFIFIDSPAVAADFTAEFEQMWGGAYGNQKIEIDNGRVYEVGDTTVELWFSPNEDAMGRILEYVDGAQESLRFTIFAFTKDQVGSGFIRKQAEFDQKDLAEGVDLDVDFRERRSVAGVIDQSQLHSNGQYHEVYRLLGGGIPMRMDGNNNSKQPGDYQAGGGRLHSKTMVIDAYGDNPVVLTGSFNWSSSATVSNDEFLMVLKGPRIAQAYDDYFESLWTNGRELGGDTVADGQVAPGDVVINEVMWYGVNSGDPDGFDEFIELRNMTDRKIDLDLWQIANPDDFVVGLPAGHVHRPLRHLPHLRPHARGLRGRRAPGRAIGVHQRRPRDEQLQRQPPVAPLPQGRRVGAVPARSRCRGHRHRGQRRPGLRGRSGRRCRTLHGAPRRTPVTARSPRAGTRAPTTRGGDNVTEPYKNEVAATPGEANSPEP